MAHRAAHDALRLVSGFRRVGRLVARRDGHAVQRAAFLRPCQWRLQRSVLRQAEGQLMGTFTGKLSGKVAVVTGASRGIGRGVALVLAEQGATGYITGRTVNPGDYYLPGTVGQTAIESDERGAPRRGTAIAIAATHGAHAQG